MWMVWWVGARGGERRGRRGPMFSRSKGRIVLVGKGLGVGVKVARGGRRGRGMGVRMMGMTD